MAAWKTYYNISGIFCSVSIACENAGGSATAQMNSWTTPNAMSSRTTRLSPLTRLSYQVRGLRDANFYWKIPSTAICSSQAF